MNYKFETIMSWITYVKNAVWGVDKKIIIPMNP